MFLMDGHMKKEIAKIKIVKYDFAIVGGKPEVVIHLVQLFDNEGKTIKFASFKEVAENLTEYTHQFKPIEFKPIPAGETL
jgi:hypothetical protein